MSYQCNVIINIGPLFESFIKKKIQKFESSKIYYNTVFLHHKKNNINLLSVKRSLHKKILKCIKIFKIRTIQHASIVKKIYKK